jgi:hypothetical protein
MKTTNRNVQGPGVTHLHVTKEPTRAVRPIFLKLLLLAVLLAAVFGISGCTALRQPEELAWQGMRVYDTLQTLDIVGDPCYKEGHAMTKQFIGENPSKGEVLAWGLGGALFHAGVSEVLLRRDMRKTYWLWQAVTIVDTGAAIRDGISIGVRVGAPNTRLPENGCR